MARYIDADALEQYFNREEWRTPDEKWWPERELGLIIDAMSTADVVEVVRCRDCIHAKQHSYAPAECQWYCTASLQYHSDRFFCACGERRME